MVTRAHLPLLTAALAGPPSGNVLELPLDAAVLAPQAGAPMLSYGTVAQGLAVRVLRLPDLTEVAVLDADDLIEASFQVAVSETGSGQVVIPLDLDPGIDINDLMWFEVDGEVVAASLVEQIDEHAMDENGPSAHTLTASGRGVGAVLEWGVIQPANGPDRDPVEVDRLFSWPSPQYDDSGWGESKIIDTGKVPDDFPGWVPWMGGPSATDTYMPGGSTYFRRTINLAADSNVIAFVALDNWGTFWVNGQMVSRIGGLTPVGAVGTWARTYTFNLALSAGEHVLGITLYNQGAIEPGQPTSSEGGAKFLLAHLNADGTYGSAIVMSDDGWKALEEKQSRVLTPNQAHYQPGMTCGEAAGIALDEVQARGGLTFVKRAFTALVDADGRPWPAAPNLSTKTGNDLLTFVQEMSVTYIDWQMDPDLTLSLYRRDGMGSASGHTLTPAPVDDPRTGDLLLLDRKRT